ncbi:MAG: DUF2723 domain-containing protein, partial [Anaerolineae bacterium]|nr:DUF2723 domain-containing protein [Anaerolineae bacterium]
ALLARRYQVTPHLLLLLPYTVFPFQSPELALLCGALAFANTLGRFTLLDNRRIEIGVFLAGLILYSLTLAPGVQPADGGEFQLVIADWGVAHPPGYPLYTLLGGIFARLLPVNDIAWRVNLFSAVTGALTLAVVAWTVRRETRVGWAAVIAAGVLGSASAFWTTSTQASIRPMTALFMGLMIAAAFEYRRAAAQHDTRSEKRALLMFGLAAGFGVTHHASLVFGGSILALAVLASRPGLLLQPRKAGMALAGALAGTLPWLYLLARGAAGARLAPPALATWDGFWQHVLASGFAGDMFYYRTLPAIAGRLGMLGGVFTAQWHWSVLVGAAAAFGLLAWRKRSSALALGGAFLLHALVTSAYRAPQTVEYMLPAYVCMAVAIGLGAGTLYQRQRRASASYAVVIALMSAAVLWSGWPTWISLRAYQHQDHTGLHAQETLQNAPADTTLLANWHRVTPLWVLQSTQALRPDVKVRYLAPQGSEPILETWTNTIRTEAATETGVITCSYYPESFRFTSLTFSSSGPCWQATNGATIPSNLVPLATFDDITLASAQASSTARAGETLVADLAWLLPEAAPYGSLTAFLHLLDDTGTVMAQTDHPFLAASPDPGLVHHRLTLRLPRTLQPGTYQLMTGLYRPGADEPLPLYTPGGERRVAIADVEVQPSALPPVTAHNMHTPFDDHLLLAGYDYDLSLPGRARLYLHWQLCGSEAGSAYTITINSLGHGLAQGQLTTGIVAGFVTTAYDIPDTAAAHGVEITIMLSGEPLDVRGAWQLPIQAAVYLPPLQARTHYIPLGDIIITGYAQQEGAPESSTTRLRITIRSTQPQTQDMTLKAITAAGLTETPPLGGMLPSLKWGWQTTFTDTLLVPAQPAPGAEEAITLTLYDAFTSETWPVFDPALGTASGALVFPP